MLALRRSQPAAWWIMRARSRGARERDPRDRDRQLGPVAGVARHRGDLADEVDLAALAEDRVLVVEPAGLDLGDEELAAVGARAGVGHRQGAGHVREVGELVVELVAGAAGA